MNTPTQTQSVSPSVMRQYRVDCALRFEGVDTLQQISFLVSSEDGSKAAWVEGRRLTRLGGAVKGVDGQVIQLQPGLYTVRNVSALERPSTRVKVISVEQLLEAAKESNLTLPKKLLELIDKLRGPTLPAPSVPTSSAAKPSAAEDSTAAA